MIKTLKGVVKPLLRPLLKPFRPDDAALLQQRIFQEAMDGMAYNHNFPETFTLPPNFGKGLPERAVEILLAMLAYKPTTKVLDIGHANAMECHLKMIETLDRANGLIGLDIAYPVYDTSQFYGATVLGDALETPFQSGSFDLIWCISTLEHFGMDNSGYTTNFKNEKHLDVPALIEMVRLLAPAGGILLTVPYGKFEDWGWFKNYDSAFWQRLLNSVRPQTNVREWHLKHTNSSGWTIVKSEELQYCGYGDQQNFGAAGLAVAYITKTS